MQRKVKGIDKSYSASFSIEIGILAFLKENLKDYGNFSEFIVDAIYNTYPELIKEYENLTEEQKENYINKFRGKK